MAAGGGLIPQTADTLTARQAKGTPTSKGDGLTLVGADVDVAGTLTGTMAGAGGGVDENGAAVGHVIPETAFALRTVGYRNAGQGWNTTYVPSEPMAFDTAPMNNAKIVPGGPAHTLNTFAQGSVHLPEPPTVFDWQKSGNAASTLGFETDQSMSLGTTRTPAVHTPEAFIVDKERAVPNADGITVEATDTAPTLTAEGDTARSTDRGLRIVQDTADVAYALRRDPGGVGQGHNTNFVPIGVSSDPTPINPPKVAVDHVAVRRLTPVECERLQGYPDGWTATSHGRPQADSHRYRELGNSIAVPVFEWIALGVLESERTGEGVPAETDIRPGDVAAPLAGADRPVVAGPGGPDLGVVDRVATVQTQVSEGSA